MLSAHNLLIAVIFIPYVVLMACLGGYIWHTSRPRESEQDAGELPLPGPAAA